MRPCCGAAPASAVSKGHFIDPQGKAGMAVANALGSNVFNVLIGLGLPYLIVQAARGRPAEVRCQPIEGKRCPTTVSR